MPLGVDAFVPLSQLGKSSIKRAADHFKVGDELPLQVIEFDKENKRIVLSASEFLKGKEKGVVDSYMTDHSLTPTTLKDIVEGVPELEETPEEGKGRKAAPKKKKDEGDEAADAPEAAAEEAAAEEVAETAEEPAAEAVAEPEEAAAVEAEPAEEEKPKKKKAAAKTTKKTAKADDDAAEKADDASEAEEKPKKPLKKRQKQRRKMLLMKPLKKKMPDLHIPFSEVTFSKGHIEYSVWPFFMALI